MARAATIVWQLAGLALAVLTAGWATGRLMRRGDPVLRGSRRSEAAV